MEQSEVLKGFLENVEHHEINVKAACDGFKHVSFKQKESREYWFELATWPGQLTFTGDIGTYVFRYRGDMFACFEQTSEEEISPGYWIEKCVAAPVSGGLREFSRAAWLEEVDFAIGEIIEYVEERGDEGGLEEVALDSLREEARTLFAEAKSHDDFIMIGRNFKWVDWHGNARVPFDWPDGTENNGYSRRYLWALFAIAWGIDKYRSYTTG